MANILVDTNLLLRRIEPNSPQRRLARFALRRLAQQGHTLCIVPHNLQEFWYTATRSKTANGYGLPAEQAYRKLTAIKSLFDLLPDTNAIYTEWEGLVATHKVVGGQSFDTRLVAAMQVHGISQILTFNDAHFRRYPGITAIHPAVV